MAARYSMHLIAIVAGQWISCCNLGSFAVGSYDFGHRIHEARVGFQQPSLPVSQLCKENCLLLLEYIFYFFKLKPIPFCCETREDRSSASF